MYQNCFTNLTFNTEPYVGVKLEQYIILNKMIMRFLCRILSCKLTSKYIILT